MKKLLKAGIVIICIAAAAVVVFLLGISDELKVQPYEIVSEKLSGNIRIALVTDLHSCEYGKKEELLINEIDSQKPDVILLGGDIFDNIIPDDNTEAFIEGICGKYPCYYVTGNHELWSGEEHFLKKMAFLDEHGIIRLSGESAEFSVRDEKINICGIDDPDALKYTSSVKESFEEQLRNVSTAAENGKYTVLLTHRPKYMPLYSKYNFDLVLSGHAHGGQWRIPGILNGLYAPPDQGLFPKYTGGKYEENGTLMIVSRGLAKETTTIPRVYNRPELVIIDLHG